MKVPVYALLAFFAMVFAAGSARADGVQFTITNFDGMGSSATFSLPSATVGIGYPEEYGPHFVVGSELYLTYAAGATVPDLFSSNGISFVTPTVFQVQTLSFFGFENDSILAGNPTVDLNGFGGGNIEYFFVSAPGSPSFFTESPLYDDTTNLPGCDPNKQVFCYGYITFQPGVYGDITITDVPTPEPASLLLVGTGLLGFARAGVRRMRRARSLPV